MREISEITSEPKFMNALAEASYRMHRLAEPVLAGDSVKASLRRAGRALDAWCKRNGLELWTENRVRDVWHADHRVRVSADELEQLRSADRARERNEADARAEVRQIVAGITSLVSRLAAVDPEFHSQAIAALGSQASAAQQQARGAILGDSAVDGPEGA